MDTRPFYQRVYALRLMVDEIGNATTAVRRKAIAIPKQKKRLNGYLEREWVTRVGLINRRHPKLRSGCYFHCMLEPRSRAKPAPLTVVQYVFMRGGQPTR